MKYSRKMSLCAALFLLFVTWVSDLQGAEKAARKGADYFNRKTITFLVPVSPGGGFDSYARMLAPFIEKYTGSTVVVKNVPGGGTLVGTIQVYKAKPDGLTIGILEAASLAIRTLSGDSLGFDLNKFTWLGRISAEQRLFVVSKKSPYRSIDDMVKATKPVKFSAVGVGSTTYNDVCMFVEGFGIKAQLVTAYEGTSEADLAVVRGDVDAVEGTYISKRKFIESGDVLPILQFGSEPLAALKGTPVLEEIMDQSKLIRTEEKPLLVFMSNITKVGRGIATATGTPQDIAQILSKAVTQALNDPQLREIAAKRQFAIHALTGPEEQQLVKRVLETPGPLRAKLVKTLSKYK